MSQIIKTFIGTFFILLLIFLGTGIISAQIDVSNAQNYKADVVAEIENSNYSPSVINACIRQAKSSSYKLSVKVYAREKAAVTYTEPAVMDTDGVEMAEVVLTYPYTITFLNSITEHSVRGYTR